MILLSLFLEKSHFVNTLCINDISLILYRKMRLWYFFRGKRFIRACICWFFIACVLPFKIPPFCWNYHVPQIALLFTIVSPHITFFETFLLKVLLFRLYFLLFGVISLLEAPTGRRWDGHIYIKGVTVRFGFDAIRTSQLPNVCQEQSNEDAPWGVSYIQPLLAHST